MIHYSQQIDLIVTASAPEEVISFYFGLSQLAWALGAGLGTSIGGFLLDSLSPQSMILWSIFMIVGIVVVLLTFTPMI